MKTLIVAFTLGLYSITAFADPCMDADVTPLGHAAVTPIDEIHLSEHGC